MAANLPKPSLDENISTILSAGITDVATSMDVSDASKIVAPCYLVIDRVDSAGTAKATSLWEYVKVTVVAGNTLTITRAQGGSTGQAHGSGAVVEAVVTSSMFEDWYNVLNPEHTATGTHILSTVTISTHLSVSGASISGGIVTLDATQTLTNKTLTSPVINGNVTGSSLATGAQITTGTADTVLVTPKALGDAGVTGLKSKVLVITRDMTAVSGDVSYTGVGFQPTAVMAVGVISGNAYPVSWGMADSASAEAAISRFEDSNFYVNVTGNHFQQLTASAGANQYAVFKNFDADGFTLTWTKAGSPTGTGTIICLCFR